MLFHKFKELFVSSNLTSTVYPTSTIQIPDQRLKIQKVLSPCTRMLDGTPLSPIHTEVENILSIDIENLNNGIIYILRPSTNIYSS